MIAAIIDGLKIISGLIGWWIKLDDQTRKEIRDAYFKLKEAEKSGKQKDIRSAINRLNAAL